MTRYSAQCYALLTFLLGIGATAAVAAPIPAEEGVKLFQKALEHSRKASYVVELRSTHPKTPAETYWQIVGTDGVCRRRFVGYVDADHPFTLLNDGTGNYVFFDGKWSRGTWFEELHRFDDLTRDVDAEVLRNAEYDRDDLVIGGEPMIQLTIADKSKASNDDPIPMKRIYSIRKDNHVIVARRLFRGKATKPIAAVELSNADFRPVVAADFFSVPEGEMPIVVNRAEATQPYVARSTPNLVRMAQQQRLEEMKKRQTSAKVRSVFAGIGRFFRSSGAIVILFVIMLSWGGAWWLRRSRR